MREHVYVPSLCMGNHDYYIPFSVKISYVVSCALKISDIMFNLKLAQALALNSSPYFIILQHDNVAY